MEAWEAPLEFQLQSHNLLKGTHNCYHHRIALPTLPSPRNITSMQLFSAVCCTTSNVQTNQVYGPQL